MEGTEEGLFLILIGILTVLVQQQGTSGAFGKQLYPCIRSTSGDWVKSENGEQGSGEKT